MDILCSFCGQFCGRSERPIDDFVCPGCVYLTAFVRYLFDTKYTHDAYYEDTKVAGAWDRAVQIHYKDVTEKVEVLKEIWANGDSSEPAV